MSQFERIHRQQNVMGGQAIIRDTGITVNEIVRLSLAGASLADILAQYPPLDADDVTQALAYGIHDTVESIAYWRHEGMTPLTHIKGFSEILADEAGVAGTSDVDFEQQHQWMKMIFESSWRAINYWQQLKLWASIHFDQPNHEFDILSLATIISQVQQALPAQEPTAELKADIEPNLPQVKANEDIVLAIVNIASAAKNTFSPITQLYARLVEDWVQIRLERALTYKDDRIHYLLEPHTAIATAALIIYQNGSELRVQEHATHTTFEFELAISLD